MAAAITSRPVRQSALIARQRWIKQIKEDEEDEEDDSEEIWSDIEEAIKNSIEEANRVMIEETTEVNPVPSDGELLIMEEELVEAMARTTVSSSASGVIDVVGPKPRPLGRWAKGKYWSNTYGTYI